MVRPGSDSHQRKDHRVWKTDGDAGWRRIMILEAAVVNVKPNQTDEFEAAFAKAQAIISSAKGYVSHELQRCLETPNRYLLLVRWRLRRGPYRGLPQILRLSGVETAAAPFLRSVSHRRAL